MSYPNCPAWGEEAVEHIVGKETVPPGGERHRYDNRLLFIETLALAIGLREDGKLLLEELRKKWPKEVEESMEEAIKRAEETDKFLLQKGY